MEIETMKSFMEFYRWLWASFNLLGKIIMFPLLVLIAPIMFIVCLGMAVIDVVVLIVTEEE